MGNSARAKLMYGYRLGGGDGEWEVNEVDEYGSLDTARFAWLPAADEDDEEDDFITEAEKHLLVTIAGFTETDWRVDGYFQREREAKARLGVAFESHCSGESPMYVLATTKISAEWGEVEAVDFAALTQQAVDERWDAKLATALRALGITPKQEQPGWLLCSYWG